MMRLSLCSKHTPAGHFAVGFERTRKFNLPDNARFTIPPISRKINTFTLSGLISRCGDSKSATIPLSTGNHGESLELSADIDVNKRVGEKGEGKSFWGAVGLIVGTAVGPGMLGLPSLTIKSGPFPSSVVILLSWVYVISSILLVADLSFAAMEEDGVGEVSFSGLASKSLGNGFGTFVAVVYASLSFALLVACVSGIGSLVSQWFPRMNPALACGSFPLAVGVVIVFFPFSSIDAANRSLCFLMLVSITSLVGIGLSVARSNVVNSFSHASWSVSAILPAIPVTILTLGFHVITPFICNVAGNTVHEVRKAVLIGGGFPLVMVLSWNLIVLGLSWGNAVVPSQDPISLLLSVKSSALPAVQGFAFSALATSLIGYAVSFPKQLIDTLGLIFRTPEENFVTNEMFIHGNGDGRVGCLVYSGGSDLGSCGRLTFGRQMRITPLMDRKPLSPAAFGSLKVLVTPVILASSVFVASFFQSTFSRALAFAGAYANCFLFGILPPLMAYIQQSRGKLRSDIIRGGNASLLLLFSIAVALGIFH